MAENSTEGVVTTEPVKDVQPNEGDQEPKSELSQEPDSQKEVEKPKSQLQKELEEAQQHPPDFNKWVSLEKLAENEKDIEVVRQVYDGLLAEYPLCYGYWKKYADAEHKHNGPEEATQVFLRAISAVPYSVDLWGHFCTFKQKIGASPDDIRKTFEQAMAYVATDYLAHGLWDKYIKFETEQGTTQNVANLYRRIMDCPIKELDRFHTSAGSFAAKHQTSEILDTASQEEYRETILKSREIKRVKAEQEKNALKAENGGEEDVKMTDASHEPITKAENANGLSTGNETVKSEIAVNKTDDVKETPADDSVKVEDLNSVTEEDLKNYWLSLCWSACEASKEELARRKQFDTAIKRPYFHVKALPMSQLQAWNSYIDYILTKNDAGSIVRLFERCLVACATYPEFWIRYVRYTEQNDANSASSILKRAQQLFCRDDVRLNLFAARYQERQGDVEAARGSYNKAVQLSPGLLSVILQAASFERRQGNVPAAREYFDQALAKEDQDEDAKASLSLFYAQFLFLDCHLSPAARDVLKEALEKSPSLRYLWEAAIHLEEYCLESGQTERVLDLYKRALKALGDSSNFNDTDLETLSQQRLDYAARQASPSIFESLQAEHDERYNKYGKIASRKRRAEESNHAPSSKRPNRGRHAEYADPNLGHHAASGAMQSPQPYSVPQQMPTGYVAPAQPQVPQVDPYAAQAYPTGSTPYGYDPYYQYPQAQAQQQYTGYQYPAYQ